MRIHVTGVAGFLGSHVAEKLIVDGNEVSGNDNLIGGSFSNVPVGVNFTPTDCQDLEMMTKKLAGVDVVYHCAATPHEGLSVFSPDLVTRNIFGATVSVTTAAIRSGVKRFVFCSSMARYGAQTPPFTEDMTPKPVDPYGISKVAAEDVLRALAVQHGMEFVILVPHNIIGPRQKYDDPYRNVAAIMMNRMMRGEQPIVYGDGSQIRCFSYVDDVIDPMLKCLTAPVSGEIINIGPDQGEVTILRLAETIADILEFRLEPVYLPGRPLEVRHANCSADKARRLLGYEPKTPLRLGLQLMAEYIRKAGPKDFRYHLPLEIVTDATPKSWKDKLI